jgi:hypothetical protein
MADDAKSVGYGAPELLDHLSQRIQASQDWLEDGASTPEQATLLADFGRRHHPWFSIVLSHRQRHPEQMIELRRAVEEILRAGCRERAVLIVSSDTPFGPYLIQAAKRLGVTTKSVVPPSLAESSNLPWIDRALIAIPDRVYVLDTHLKSKTFELLVRRLGDDRFPKGSVFLDSERALNSDPSPIGIQDTKRTKAWVALLASGAVFRIRYWPIAETHTANLAAANEAFPASFELPPNISQPLVPIIYKLPRAYDESSSESLYLTHCTRARNGPWPDQSKIGYLESLIGIHDAQVSPMDTLIRILSQQRILATDHLKRGKHQSVSLSSVQLLNLLSRRRFRPHLGRWDWEPYGICILARTLERLGARPVRYGPSAIWAQLPEEERPFFQAVADTHFTSTPHGEAPSWEEEREWRVPSDVRLASIPFTDAFVFVPKMDEAIHLQPLSRFPILCLERLITI